VAACLALAAVAFVTAQLPSANPQAARPRAGQLFRMLYVPGLVVGAAALVWAWAALSGALSAGDHTRVTPIPWPFTLLPSALQRGALPYLLAGIAIHVGGIVIGATAAVVSGRRADVWTQDLPEGCAQTPPLSRAQEDDATPVADRMLDLLAVVLSGAGAGLALWFGMGRLFPTPGKYPAIYALFGVPYVLGCYWVGTSLYVGIFSRCTSEEDREWWARAGGLSLKIAGIWMALFAIVVYGPPLLLAGGLYAVTAMLAAGGVSGIATAVGGYWSKVGVKGPSQQSPQWSALLARWGLPVGAAVFLLVLLVGLSALTSAALDPWSFRASWQAVDPSTVPAHKLAERMVTLDKYLSGYQNARRNADEKAEGKARLPTPPVSKQPPVSPPASPPVSKPRGGTDPAPRQPGEGAMGDNPKTSALVTRSAADQARADEEKGLVRSYLQAASAIGAGADSYALALQRFHEATTAKPPRSLAERLLLVSIACFLVSVLGLPLLNQRRPRPDVLCVGGRKQGARGEPPISRSIHFSIIRLTYTGSRGPVPLSRCSSTISRYLCAQARWNCQLTSLALPNASSNALVSRPSTPV